MAYGDKRLEGGHAASHPEAEPLPNWKRMITIRLPDGRQHTVGVTNDHLHPPYEQLAGAIRMVTSLAVPEVLKHRFFPNL